MSPDGAGVVLSVTVIGTAGTIASASLRSSARPAMSPPASAVFRASASAAASRSSTFGFTSGVAVTAATVALGTPPVGAAALHATTTVANTARTLICDPMSSRRALDLDGSQQERADPVVIVRRDGPGGVVRERAVAIGRATEPGADAAAGDVHVALAVRAYEALNDGVVRAPGQPAVCRGQVPLTLALRERVREHAGRRLLEVIPSAVALIHHLPPQSAAVLHQHDRVGELPEVGDQRRALSLVLEDVEHVHQRHRIPADRARPERPRPTGDRIGPRLRPALVDRVIEEAGVLVARVVPGERALLHYIGVWRGPLERRGVFRDERAGHVHAIEPHLVGVDPLVPEAARRRARLRPQLSTQAIECRTVLRVAALAQQREEDLPRVDEVEAE